MMYVFRNRFIATARYLAFRRNNGGASGGFSGSAPVTATSPSGLGNYNSNSCMGSKWGRKHASNFADQPMDASGVTIPDLGEMDDGKNGTRHAGMLTQNRDKMAKLMTNLT